MRLGVPQMSDGFGESMRIARRATGVGLLYYAAQETQPAERRETRATKVVGSVGNVFKRVFDVVKSYL